MHKGIYEYLLECDIEERDALRDDLRLARCADDGAAKFLNATAVSATHGERSLNVGEVALLEVLHERFQNLVRLYRIRQKL